MNMPKKKRVSDSESDSEDDRKQRKRMKKDVEEEEEVEFEIEDLKKFTPRKRLRKKRNFSEDEEDSSEENDSDYASERELRCNETRGQPYDEKESFKDAITLDDLEKRHIDWVSPDRNMKICYNLSTIISIAITKGISLKSLENRENTHSNFTKTYLAFPRIQEI